MTFVTRLTKSKAEYVVLAIKLTVKTKQTKFKKLIYVNVLPNAGLPLALPPLQKSVAGF